MESAPFFVFMADYIDDFLTFGGIVLLGLGLAFIDWRLACIVSGGLMYYTGMSIAKGGAE